VEVINVMKDNIDRVVVLILTALYRGNVPMIVERVREGGIVQIGEVEGGIVVRTEFRVEIKIVTVRTIRETVEDITAVRVVDALAAIVTRESLLNQMGRMIVKYAIMILVMVHLRLL